MRESLRGSPHFDACEEFCRKWDEVAFDPAYEFKELEQNLGHEKEASQVKRNINGFMK